MYEIPVNGLMLISFSGQLYIKLLPSELPFIFAHTAQEVPSRVVSVVLVLEKSSSPHDPKPFEEVHL